MRQGENISEVTAAQSAVQAHQHLIISTTCRSLGIPPTWDSQANASNATAGGCNDEEVVESQEAHARLEAALHSLGHSGTTLCSTASNARPTVLDYHYAYEHGEDFVQMRLRLQQWSKSLTRTGVACPYLCLHSGNGAQYSSVSLLQCVTGMQSICRVLLVGTPCTAGSDTASDSHWLAHTCACLCTAPTLSVPTAQRSSIQPP
jgi:hypothetical protein